MPETKGNNASDGIVVLEPQDLVVFGRKYCAPPAGLCLRYREKFFSLKDDEVAKVTECEKPRAEERKEEGEEVKDDDEGRGRTWFRCAEDGTLGSMLRLENRINIADGEGEHVFSLVKRDLLSMTKKITVLGPDGTTAMFKIKEVPSMSTWTLVRTSGLCTAGGEKVVVESSSGLLGGKATLRLYREGEKEGGDGGTPIATLTAAVLGGDSRIEIAPNVDAALVLVFVMALEQLNGSMLDAMMDIASLGL